MEMLVGARVVSGRSVAVRELGGEVAADERFESLVDGREGDGRNVATDRGEYLVGGGMGGRSAEMAIDGGALLGKALPVRLQHLAERGVDLSRRGCREGTHGFDLRGWWVWPPEAAVRRVQLSPNAQVTTRSVEMTGRTVNFGVASERQEVIPELLFSLAEARGTQRIA